MVQHAHQASTRRNLASPNRCVGLRLRLQSQSKKSCRDAPERDLFTLKRMAPQSGTPPEILARIKSLLVPLVQNGSQGKKYLALIPSDQNPLIAST